MANYSIRRYRGTDCTPYLELFESIFAPRDIEWFRWKYEQNPYIDDVPIFVAESGGEMVGVRSFFALELAHGDSSSRVLQPCDTMVCPEHRREGIMTRMTERAIETYADTASFFFNTPNQEALSVNRKLGWHVVDTPPTYFRIENIHSRVPPGLEPMIERAVDPFFPPVRSPDPRQCLDPAVDIDRHSDVPIDALVSLYRQAIPETFHAVRDRQFYEWRFSNPRWEYRTYLALRDGKPIASIVAGTRSNGMETITRLVDFLPIEPDESHHGAIAALIDAIVADQEETDIFAMICPPSVDQLASDLGFISDTTFPLTYLCEGLTLVARPLNGSWTIDGLRIDSPGSWSFTFAERDTS